MSLLDKTIRAKGPYELPPACGGRLRLFKGTVEHWLLKFDRMSFDAALCDPPYELGFMGHEWDKAGVAFDPKMWGLVLRALKPGAHLMTFGGRFVHRQVVAAEDAGFDVVDTMLWLHGQGFPKGVNISKAIDAKLGASRKKVKATGGLHKNRLLNDDNWSKVGDADATMDSAEPVTPDAKRFAGYNTALKPAVEQCPIFRRPLATGKTYAANCLLYNTGGLNINPCRIGSDAVMVRGGGANHYAGVKSFLPYQAVNQTNVGRFPSNVVLSHHPLCRRVGTKKVKTGTYVGRNRDGNMDSVVYGKRKASTKDAGYGGADGTETVDAFRCVPGCPVRMLDRQTGTLTSGVPGIRRKDHETVAMSGRLGTTGRQEVGYADSGGASRFFYIAKVDRAERDAGCTGPLRDTDNFGDDEWGKENRKVQQAVNAHACLKPIDLNRYFATLILPPPSKAKRRILVPFGGSGSEAIGALLAGWDEVWLIEQDATHVRHAGQRAEHWLAAR